MKSFSKTIFRMFKSNKGRFIANFLIVLLSIALSSGLACLPTMYTDSYLQNYEEKNTPDIILKSKSNVGFTIDDINKVKENEGISTTLLTTLDIEQGSNIYRLYFVDFTSDISKLDLVNGSLPSEDYSFNVDYQTGDISITATAVSEIGNKNRNSYNINDTLNIVIENVMTMTFDITITGNVNSSLYNSVQKENATLVDENNELIEDKYVNAIIYLDQSVVDRILPKTDMYIVYKNKSNYFSKKYQEEMDIHKEELLNQFGEDNVSALTLEENISYALYKNYNDKVQAIAYIFPFFFILVCALVNLITITKLIKDERSVIATYTSLGISKHKIVLKYFLFTLFSTLLGAIIGLGIGIPVLPTVIESAYAAVFEMGTLNYLAMSWYGFMCAGLLVLVALGVTLGSALSYLKETPASLMKQKSPKPGKKILLQRIKFIWNNLSFKYKSSFRNIFRQKKNLILTSLSIIGSTLLVLIGFSLMDVSNSLVNDDLFSNVASSMGSISFVIIAFAISMAVVVIYSLANMNIGDRERELATLKVLGYKDVECSFYTFREILIISIFAVIVGLPISAGIIAFVFDYLEFGSIADVRWISYLYTVIIVLGTTMIVNLLLYSKIKKIDMNNSLKILE